MYNNSKDEKDQFKRGDIRTWFAVFLIWSLNGICSLSVNNSISILTLMNRSASHNRLKNWRLNDRYTCSVWGICKSSPTFNAPYIQIEIGSMYYMMFQRVHVYCVLYQANLIIQFESFLQKLSLSHLQIWSLKLLHLIGWIAILLKIACISPIFRNPLKCT